MSEKLVLPIFSPTMKLSSVFMDGCSELAAFIMVSIDEPALRIVGILLN